MHKRNHFIKRITQKDGVFLLHCYTKKENFYRINEIVCKGASSAKCIYEKISENNVGVNYQVTLPVFLKSPCTFFIVLDDNTRIKAWKPWKTLTASSIPSCFYFTYNNFNLAYNLDAKQIIEKRTNGANTIKSILTKLNFRKNKIYLSGYLLVSTHSRILLEKVFLYIVKFREEGKRYSFDVVTSPIDDQKKFKRFKKKYYVEFWRQEIIKFRCIIDLERIKLEKGFFKLFIEYNGYFANIKNYDKKLQEKDHCYPIQLPFFKEVLFVPYCDDIVNTWRLDIYHFNLLERIKLRHLFEKYSEDSLPEKDPNTWLIGEYQNTARDNGMHFFQYLRTMHPTIDAYYIIYDDSPDKKNLNDSHVISYGSYKHFAISVKAKVLVFSHAANFLVPKINKIIDFKNKYQAYHTIFIQHGIIATTAHALIYRKKIREYERFVVSSSLEKEIIHKHLGYAKKNIIITGLARWDKLLSISTKTTDILIMPTWRNDLNNVSTDIFKQSGFFKFWNSLLTNDDFLYLIRKKNITVNFFLHFALSRFSHCFDLSAEIKQINDDRIQFLLASCGLLVTDYSSVAFDVLLQNKPVIFAPFDYNKMIVLRKGAPFIDYEKDLPGPVCYDVNTTLENIKKHIANGYTIEPEYRERREKFFTYIDRHNSDRIFLEINKLISS